MTQVNAHQHVLTAPASLRPLGFDLLRFARFLGVGGLAAGTNFASRFAWSLVLPFEAAVICARPSQASSIRSCSLCVIGVRAVKV